LQQQLIGYPNWEIVMALASPDKAGRPNMILIIRDDEIIDGLQRQSFGPSNTREAGRWDRNSAMSSIRGRARFDPVASIGSPKCKSLQAVQKNLDSIRRFRLTT